MPRRRNKGKRQSAFRVPGASISHQSLTGKVTPFTKTRHVILNKSVVTHDLREHTFPAMDIWGSYKVSSVDVEIPPGIGCSFRVLSNWSPQQEVGEEVFADPRAVTQHNMTTKRKIYRYKPTEAPYTGVQPTRSGLNTGLILACTLLSTQEATTEHSIWLRYNLLLMDQIDL